MNILHIIDKKRLGQAHTLEELSYLVSRMMQGELPDYQLSAWLMAVCCNGLSMDETAWLTELYVHSGKRMDFSGVDGIIVDKHSTGGVGDKTTLIIGPLLAACGVKVAKLSGRGLGFTGGTVDKLESIPGFQVGISMEQIRRQIERIGIALGSQTQELAPADAKIYALRDVTATVASIPLIAASVVSKKIAAGAKVITLDIKVGEGAFMKTLEDAKALAYTCREVGRRLGCAISTVISDMSQPLGYAVGHSVEVIECIETLKGYGPKDLSELCLALCALTLVDAQVCRSQDDARALLKETIASGRAIEKFEALVMAQQGNPRIIEDYSLFAQPKVKETVASPVTGLVSHCHALQIAEAAKVLGAGRLRKDASIDLSVGVVLRKKVGDLVQQGEPLVELWANERGLDEARHLVSQAFQFSKKPVAASPLIVEIHQASAQADAVAN